MIAEAVKAAVRIRGNIRSGERHKRVQGSTLTLLRFVLVFEYFGLRIGDSWAVDRLDGEGRLDVRLQSFFMRDRFAGMEPDWGGNHKQDEQCDHCASASGCPSPP